MDAALFLTGFGLGFAICASPGAVTTQAVQRGLEHGFGAAMTLQIGALVGIALWGIIGLMGAALLAGNDVLRVVLSIGSVALLLWLAWKSLRSAYRGQPPQDAAGSTTTRGDFALGAALSLINPLPMVFWLGVGSTVMPSPSLLNVAVFFAGLMSSAVLWSVLLAALTAWGKRYVTPMLFRVVNGVCGVALGVFAIRLVWSMISG
jgi:chemosensory pili system protein ChpE